MPFSYLMSGQPAGTEKIALDAFFSQIKVR